MKQTQKILPCCPECGAKDPYRAGFYYPENGDLPEQRFQCRNKRCKHRFIPKHKKLKNSKDHNDKHQIGVFLQDMKNLDSATETKTVAGDKSHKRQKIRGRIVEFSFYMKKQGYAEETNRLYRSAMKVLSDRGADLDDPESVKDVISRQKWSGNRKRNVINGYTLFLKIQGRTWEKPKVTIIRKIPFIPTEQEIDDLIAGCPTTIATFLQLLKETASRSGEAIRLKWTDVDLKRRMITLNEPEKGSNPRIFTDLNGKLLSMLNALPKENEYLFGHKNLNSLKASFSRSRKKIALKLQNPRLQKIHFHTLRHWKATMEYHYIRDILIVADLLGHKDLEQTRKYIQLEKKLFKNIADDKFTIKTAKTLEEATELGEVGFEPFVVIKGVQLFRKRK